MTACTNGGEWRRAVELFVTMQREGVRADAVALIDPSCGTVCDSSKGIALAIYIQCAIRILCMRVRVHGCLCVCVEG